MPLAVKPVRTELPTVLAIAGKGWKRYIYKAIFKILLYLKIYYIISTYVKILKKMHA